MTEQNQTTATCLEYPSKPCPIPNLCEETNRCLAREFKLAGWRVLEPWEEMKPGEHRQIGSHASAFRPSVDPQPWDEEQRRKDEPGTVRWYFGKPSGGESA